MHLRYFLNEEGKRVYTLKNVLDDGAYTFNAHPGYILSEF
jgi:H/ACA ribonucleoprotein complex subunit 3